MAYFVRSRAMIVRDRLPLLRVWPLPSRRLAGLLAFDIAISVAYTVYHLDFVAVPSLPLAMVGGALSIFLAFRNNSAYDRWWEARTLWGGLVNRARTFARQTLTLIDTVGEPSGDASCLELVRLQSLYVHALRCHLRRQNPFPELQSALPPETITWLRTQRNVPIAILLRIGQILRRLYDAKRMDSFRFLAFDDSLTDLCNIQGACERIKNTPLPRQYEYFPRVIVSMYCILLPIGLVQGMGLLTPVASTLISFIFISLECIGRDLENPFETTVHDTPLSSLSRMIDNNLRQSVGSTELAPEVRPVDGFVY